MTMPRQRISGIDPDTGASEGSRRRVGDMPAVFDPSGNRPAAEKAKSMRAIERATRRGAGARGALPQRA